MHDGARTHKEGKSMSCLVWADAAQVREFQAATQCHEAPPQPAEWPGSVRGWPCLLRTGATTARNRAASAAP